MSKIEEAAKPLGFNVHKNNYKMKLKGDKTVRKGHLSVATEVSVTTDGCQAKILPFSGRPGLYIEGSVSPPISGVDIRVVIADNSGDAPLQKGELVLETTIEPDGFFIGRPLYDDADYDIEASKGYGRSLWLMQGMFRANGGCGYVKKPEFLLKVGPHNEVFDPRASLPVKQILKVRVYMGEGWHMDFHHTHFDVYSPPDFYTRVGIGGVFADSVMKKTKTVEDNWTPVWNEEFEFPLTVPELALLRIEVHEYDMSKKDDFGGQTCLPLSELRA